ncbi:hypothetical protein [Candidatus Odyssella thessalonicensis]|uniref:hypothetical protein n=1 Tax=Candidatus Odyssella thessalonicensis TaxID=84647 RepID=UPI000225B1DF|nr:hypothetical protein [Candidatus Odyssella thessalonicensis]
MKLKTLQLKISFLFLTVNLQLSTSMAMQPALSPPFLDPCLSFDNMTHEASVLIKTEEDIHNQFIAVQTAIENNIKEIEESQVQEADGSDYSRWRKALKLNNQALKIVKESLEIYSFYKRPILWNIQQKRDTFGLGFIRYAKFLSFSQKLAMLQPLEKDKLLPFIIRTFQEAVDHKLKNALPPTDVFLTEFIDIRSADDIRLSHVRLINILNRGFKNVLNLLDKIDLNKLNLTNLPYKALLETHLNKLRGELNVFFREKKLVEMVKRSNINLVIANGFPFNFGYIQNYMNIHTAYNIIFSLLNHRFHNRHLLLPEYYDLYAEEECVMLSEVERTENLKTLQSMLAASNSASIEAENRSLKNRCNKQPVSSSKKLAQVKPSHRNGHKPYTKQKSRSKQSNTNRRKAKQQLRIPLVSPEEREGTKHLFATPGAATESLINFPLPIVSTSAPSSTLAAKTTASDIDQAATPSKETHSTPKAETASLSPITAASDSMLPSPFQNAAAAAMIAEPKSDNLIQECTKWLQGLLQKTAQKPGNYVSIFNKARHLLIDLENNGEQVLLGIQEATHTLAQRLNDLRQADLVNKKKTYGILIPKNYEADYLLLMHTPITYLHNNLRFSLVKRLLKGLGGKIDDSHSGSRIAFELNKKKMSIHLHNAHNGILDGGRITSLRKLITDAGVYIQE